MKDPKKELENFLNLLNDLDSKQDKNQGFNVIAKLREKLEADSDEFILVNTEFSVERPQDTDETEYACLKDILEPGFKTSEFDENGYSVTRPVFNELTPTEDVGVYHLVKSSRSFVLSSLYSRYIDEPCIIFREKDNSVLYFKPEENESVAIKMSGLEGYRLKESFRNTFDLEYVYLKMSEPQFIKQFVSGLNLISLLNGWIPIVPIEKQKNNLADK